MHVKERETIIKSLIDSMTVEEKISQLLHQSPAVERLGIPEYNWWNEALHGVARAGTATVFPQAIGLAASFDRDMVKSVASAISDEARAKYNQSVKSGLRLKYHGLTFWSPNVNIFRDPRWGRGQETFGEDPYLSGELGLEFVRGLQGDDRENLKTAACAKHFAVHSGPEALRHAFDARVSLKDLYETYLPAFRKLVRGGVEAVMGAYNRTLGEACCASDLLMNKILRGEWEFSGHYVSDCWAIRDFHEHHGLTETPEESAALALSRGCDLNCGCVYEHLLKAVNRELVPLAKIDESLTRLYRTRARLGILREDDSSDYDDFGPELIRSPGNLALARRAAEESIVLLKNDNNLLPIKKKKQRILLIGPSAANLHTLLGNYHGLSPHLVSILEGVTGKLADNPHISMDYHPGCLMYSENRNTGWTIGMAEQADLVIAVFGLDSAIEGEEGDAIASDDKGDRTSIELPPWQLDYLRALRERGTPLVLVMTGGSPVIIPEDIADSILFVWYPGERGGEAVADVLFGDVNPSGKLPVTFPLSTEQLPPYRDYSMRGRTYRFMKKEPLFPFGFGLSYTRFRLSDLKLSKTTIGRNDFLELDVTVHNEGDRDGAEVVQIYLSRLEKSVHDYQCTLAGFDRVFVKSGESRRVTIRLESEQFETVNSLGESELHTGAFELIAGDSSPLATSRAKGAAEPLRATLQVEA